MKKKLNILTTLLLLTAICTAPAQKTKVACIGNSITEGVSITFHRAQAYPAVLQAYLGEDHYEVKNFGVSGHTMLRNSHAPYWNTTEYQNALDYRPDIVIIKLGTNDSGASLWDAYKNEFKSDYLDFINSFRTVNEHTRFYLCHPVPIFPEDSPQANTLVQEVIPLITQIAAEAHATVIDLHTPLKGTRDTFFADDLHPNAMGARRMAFLIAPYLSPNFDKKEEDVNLISYILPFDRTDHAIRFASSVTDYDVAPLFDNRSTLLPPIDPSDKPYFEVELSEKTKVTSYTLTVGEADGSPRTWLLQAFRNNRWMTLHRQQNVTFLPQETKVFEIPFTAYASMASASAFRLLIQETAGAHPLSLAEWQLFGTPVTFPQAWTDNGGRITDQYGLNAHEGVQYLIDRNADTKYCAVEKGYTYWVQYTSPVPVKAAAYTLTTANDVPDRDPTDWTLEGSLNGIDWELLDTQTCRYFMSRYSTLEFPLSSDKEYTHFRLHISRLRHGNTFQLAEWQLLPHTASSLPAVTPTTCHVHVSGCTLTIGSSSDTPLHYTVYNLNGQCIDAGELSPQDQISKPYVPGLYLISSTSDGRNQVIKVSIGR